MPVKRFWASHQRIRSVTYARQARVLMLTRRNRVNHIWFSDLACGKNPRNWHRSADEECLALPTAVGPRGGCVRNGLKAFYQPGDRGRLKAMVVTYTGQVSRRSGSLPDWAERDGGAGGFGRPRGGVSAGLSGEYSTGVRDRGCGVWGSAWITCVGERCVPARRSPGRWRGGCAR